MPSNLQAETAPTKPRVLWSWRIWVQLLAMYALMILDKFVNFSEPHSPQLLNDLVFSAPSELVTNTYKVILKTVKLYTNVSIISPHKPWRNYHSPKSRVILGTSPTDLESARST